MGFCASVWSSAGQDLTQSTIVVRESDAFGTAVTDEAPWWLIRPIDGNSNETDPSIIELVNGNLVWLLGKESGGD